MSTLPTSNPRGYGSFTTSVIFDVLAGVFVIGRCIARFGIVRACGADDVLILFAVATSVTFTALIEVQNQHGLGIHFDVLTPSEQVAVLKPFWASVIMYYLALTLVKSSILCQFQRFFVGSTSRKVCWALLALVVVYGLCTILGAVFSCLPVSYFWDKTSQKGQCINLLAFWFSNATFNILSDIAIIILPMPVLYSLQLPKKQKYSLIFVFAVGGFGCITSIIRLHSLYVVAHSADLTWDNVGAATWSTVELNVGIICACLPTLKPLFPKFLHQRQRKADPKWPENHMRYAVHNDAAGGFVLTDDVVEGQEFPLPKAKKIQGDEDKAQLRSGKDEDWATAQHCEVKSPRESGSTVWQATSYVSTRDSI